MSRIVKDGMSQTPFVAKSHLAIIGTNQTATERFATGKRTRKDVCPSGILKTTYVAIHLRMHAGHSWRENALICIRRMKVVAAKKQRGHNLKPNREKYVVIHLIMRLRSLVALLLSGQDHSTQPRLI